MGARIVYKNYALIDKSMTHVQSSDVSEFACLEDLKYSNAPKKPASFEEQYMYSDVEYPFYEEGWEDCAHLGYVSASMCDASGAFDPDVPPSVEIFMSESGTQVQAASDGIMLYFSPWEEEYATEVEILWLISDSSGVIQGEPVRETFYPDKNIYFCARRVENYTKVEIRFKKWSFGNRRARLYRIEYGRETVYEGDDVFSTSVDESVHLVSDQITVNTSSVVLVARSQETFQKQQVFEVWYGDRRVAVHHVKDIKIQDSRVTITGNDVLARLDSGKVRWPAVLEDTFASWLHLILEGTQEDVPAVSLDMEHSDAALLSRRLRGSIPEEVSRREALTAICLAMGAYVDTSGSGGIAVKSAKAVLDDSPGGTLEEGGDPEEIRTIPETQVFSGDSTEIKEAYRTLTIKYKDISGVEHTTNAQKNAVYPDGAQDLELDLSMLCIEGMRDSEEEALQYPWQQLLELYAKYYFHSEFYTAKAVMGEEIAVGDRIWINGKDAFLTQRTLYLDGDKVIADGTYKLVEGR